MSRLNYILPRHRTQSRTFAYMINGTLFAPDLIWQDVGDLLDPNYLQTLRERERERDYIALAYESLVISIFLKKYHVSGCLELRIFDSIDALRAFNRMAKCLKLHTL